LGQGANERVFALGAQKALVGRDDYADFPPLRRKSRYAGNYTGPSVEKCIALRPIW
jgi:ABC-type hemin transport system substrate-binding protein